MENPGLKVHASPAQHPVTTNSIAEPQVWNLGGPALPTPNPAFPVRQNVETAPEPTGVKTPEPASAANGAEAMKSPEALDAERSRKMAPGAGSSAENPAWTKAHQTTQDKMQARRMGAVDPEEWRDSDLTWMRSEPAFERLRRGDPMRGTHPEPGVSYKDFNIPKPGEPWIEGLHDMSLLDEPYHMNPWGGMEKLNAAEPNYEDPLYPFKGWSQGEPEDTTDLDNLQPGDDAYHDFSPDARPTHPLLKDVNRILDEGSEEGSDALASGLNTIFKSQEGTEGLPLEERKRRGEKAIDEYVKGLKGTHAEKVKALRADWDARGGRKTGEPVPVARFSPRHKHPDGQYIVPMDGNPFPQSQSVIRYQGDCKGCGRSTFMDDAGDFSDPRGPIGDYTSDPMHAHEFDMHGPSIPACFNCQNDYEQYKKLESKGMGHKAGDPTGGFHWTWQRQPDGSQKNVRIDHTHAKDKKGIWHAPGEKPGLCTDCGPMKAEAAWADFLRADVD